ncbi:biotin-dependent carboxyltransferase family protein [Cytobacillus sp. Sa5YUA1]|uniref:Biotin-dependent carboxyltransferase family protein n=1 Tax=Cytobacillus stercorigallinarum TaxID=2762240 RepID=A0ABR8QUR7_9BACI|nr:biotin-dependent carboxyltransferase family protein [Cytobacillus stercorigallinarum]MBD7939286.1 biotin-dependent carboxyltransferase family protein [Cytobacillus stercorigallinarum]
MIEIKKPGLLTTVQDLGRTGFQKYGVIASGVMDQDAHKIANMLVGNNEEQPTLEMTLIGPRIVFHEDCLISLCGGDIGPQINGQKVRLWRPIWVKAKSELTFGSYKEGCRTYLAIAGGFDVEVVMDSYATYLRAHIGGHKGRALQKGDQLSLKEKSRLSGKIMDSLKQPDKPFVEAQWSIPIQTRRPSNQRIRVIEGKQFSLFNKDSKIALFSHPYKVASQSDRMGYRLSGSALALSEEKEMISEAVTMGTIQVPPDGQPIILMADRQTTGGYPKIGQVASIDLHVLAQTKPGEEVYFEKISFAAAQRLYIQKEQRLYEYKKSIQIKYR